jgi:Zn-finger nucleic acid-binding protein
MIDDTPFHECQECGAEFSIELAYNEFEEMEVCYCPVCGTSLADEDELEGFDERYDEND